jgi:hypothetical protein
LRIDNACFAQIKIIEDVLASIEFVAQLAPAAFARYPRGFAGHVAVSLRSILLKILRCCSLSLRFWHTSQYLLR